MPKKKSPQNNSTRSPIFRFVRTKFVKTIALFLNASMFALLAVSLQAEEIPSQTTVQSDKYNFKAVGSWIKNLMKNTNTPSVSVAVSEDGKIVWEASFGWANRKTMLKATPHTMYSLASVSKPFTASGLMVLVEKGLVDILRPVNTYLGKAKLRAFEESIKEATVKRVLHHTAGLPMHWQFFFDNEFYQRPVMDETIERFGILVSPPGDIERVSLKSYAEYMKTEVFEPLGLFKTEVFTKKPDIKDVAERYIENKSPSPFYDFDHRGASAVYSSTHDLVRFGMFHLKNHLADQKAILSDSAISDMQNSFDPDLPACHYALGWDVGERFGYPIVSHEGGMPGVRTMLLMLPSENIAVAVLSNGEYLTPNRVYDLILSAMLPDYRKNRMQRAHASNTGNQKTSPSLSRLAGTWAGQIFTYSGRFPVQMTFDKNGKGGTLAFNTSTSKKIICEPIDPLRFENGVLTGKYAMDIPIYEAERARHSLFLKIKLSENRLSGSASALSFREFFCLSSYIELKKR
jgi:CubicO group peptidase (beta-lactamase class C family)